MNSMQFYEDVLRGLSKTPKELYARYFYDEAGDRLFQKIMDLPEYYLFDCELEIIQEQGNNIVEHLPGIVFDIVELGAGDGRKTQFLLKALAKKQGCLTYFPIDISPDSIAENKRRIQAVLPEIHFKGLAGTYFEMLPLLGTYSKRPKLILFLGSSIGNFNHEAALSFLRQLRQQCRPQDFVLIGFDLKKDPDLILNAYNDAAGVTREFNLNLLRRINRELAGNFPVDAFVHEPVYLPETGECKSFLRSTKKMTVRVGEARVPFEKDESIFMEISQKYTIEEVNRLARNAGFTSVTNFFDKKNWFVNALWKCGAE